MVVPLDEEAAMNRARNGECSMNVLRVSSLALRRQKKPIGSFGMETAIG
jgi:hypothetical protein